MASDFGEYLDSARILRGTPVLASEHLLGALVLAAVLTASSGWSRPAVRSFVAGLMVGAATLTRGDGLVYGVVILGVRAVNAPWSDGAGVAVA